MTISNNPAVTVARKRTTSKWGLNPFDWYEKMLREDPVHYDEQEDLWDIFRYDDIKSILANYTVFSSERGGEAQRETASILSLDPPKHRKLRALISQAFTPRSISELEPRIKTIVNALLDKGAANGHLDIISDLAYPLPVIVIAEMLGIPAQDRTDFKRWSDDIVSSSGEQAMHGWNALAEYFRKVFEEKRRQPGNDLVSALLKANLDGEPLTELEIISFCNLLLVAGNETTTNLIGNAMLCFEEHPDVLPQLQDDPTLIPGALEEVLRYRSPVQRVSRLVKEDTTIRGKTLKAGQMVFLWLGAANRDPERFPNPQVFDIRRKPNQHFAFGHGIHTCIGAPLARLESNVAFECLLERFDSEIKLEPGNTLQPISTFFGYGIEHFPVALKQRA